ncbi:MAG: hypothetical protein ACR2II_01210 [Chthoniobacterales bacterium]
MFPLPTKTFPVDAEALRAALEESILRFVRPIGLIVTVEDAGYPKLAAIRLSLDGASAGERQPPRPLPPVGPVEPGLRVEDFQVSGRPIIVQRAKVELTCSARDVQFNQGRDRDGNVLLLLQEATNGRVEVAIALSDLEDLVLGGARTEAAKQGVKVESVRIELQASSERALEVIVYVSAKKLFLNAALRISGSVAIDGQLNARLAGLKCAGEGALGTLACGFVAPHLARFDGREFSLLALPLGEVKLRDVRIAAGRELRVTAQFGRPA